MSTMTASEARAELPALLDRVAEGDEVTITRHGQAVAVVLRPDAVRSRRAASAFTEADRIQQRLDRARTASLSDARGLSIAEAEDLVAQVRAGRDAR